MKIADWGGSESRLPVRGDWFFNGRPWARTAAVCVVAVLALAAGAGAQRDDAAERRAAVKAQFARAQGLLQALEAKGERERSLKEYLAAVAAFRRVYLITPRAAEVPTAIKQVADLYLRMGQQFDPAYFRSALTSYEFLVHEYPASKYVQEAQLAIAGLYKGPLNDPQMAKQAYQEFLQQHPRSPHAAEARAALGEIADWQKKAGVAKPPAAQTADSQRVPNPAWEATNGPGAAPEMPAAGSGATAGASAGSNAAGPPAQLGEVRVFPTEESTRVVIELSRPAKYQAARITRPDRIYFDLENARLPGRSGAKTVPAPADSLLKSVRVAMNRPNVVRVVLEPNQVKDYSVFELSNPDRLVIDVYGSQPGAGSAGAAAEQVQPRQAALPEGPASANTTAPARTEPKSAVTATPAKPASEAVKSAPGTTTESEAAKAAPQAPLLSAKKAAEAARPASLPEPVRDGGRSLTRVLGLKVGRIVIDAGHGGHDTGTTGPTGLMEKDVCLDVALRLGKIIQQRLPFAEIVYTREDDSYVALEQRTAMANDARADLLVSIHANSSDDRKVRGIETYYLNFNAAPAAMEVAARENALAQGGVHQLEELVKKIARNEKIEESRDLAENIQESLAKQASASARNRGVRKAPFVVLIGANMPSVLTEISFLSNPVDEQWLKKPDSRQKIAEGIYRGIERYLKSTNSLARNVSTLPIAGGTKAPYAAEPAGQ